MEKKVKRSFRDLTRKEFHRKTNIITLLLLIYIIILLISTSKVMDRLGQMEIERSYMTGEATGNVSLTIIPQPSTAVEIAVATTAAEAAAVLSQPLTSSKTLVKLKPSKFVLDLYFEEKKTEVLEVTNILNIPLDLNFTSNLLKYVTFDPKVIHLEPDETKKLMVTFIGDKPGVVSGYIYAKGKTIKSFMLVILDVSSEGLPGKIEINIPEQFKQVYAGDNILVSVSLSGFNDENVDLDYIIKNVENKEIFKISQAINVKDSLKFDKNIALPNDIHDGLYILAAELKHGGQKIVDSEVFTVGMAKEPEIETPGILGRKYVVTENQFKMIVLGIIVLIVLAAVFYAHEVKTIKKHSYEKKK